MPDKAVYLFVFDGFADWEPAHAAAELRRHGHYRVETVGLTMEPVQSMGGIRVLPSSTVAQVDATDVAAFILPGGDAWESSPIELPLAALLRRLDAGDVPLAAICGATLPICRLGLLRGRRHTPTSCARTWWKVRTRPIPSWQPRCTRAASGRLSWWSRPADRESGKDSDPTS